MTELDLRHKLGIISEPVQNRVQEANVPIVGAHQMKHLLQIFQINRRQRLVMGTANPDLWCEFLPWHSLN